MWYLNRGVILTKDNLARWNWNGNKQCCFCFSDETIQHLFIDCHVAKFLWRAVQFAFDLNPPRSITHLFSNWLRGVGTKLKRQLLVGASALCWAIWLNRNEVVFNRTTPNSMQVIFRGTYWRRSWSLLSKEEERSNLKINCRKLEITVMELFNKFGWKFSNRIQD